MKQEPIPQAGGSYTRDEKTGELVKAAPAEQPATPMPAAPEQVKKEQAK